MRREAAPSQHQPPASAENIVLIRAASPAEAIQRGEEEAQAYASANDADYLGFIDTFHMFTDTVDTGTELYSLMRTSSLPPNDFVTRYFDDGTQHAEALDEK